MEGFIVEMLGDEDFSDRQGCRRSLPRAASGGCQGRVAGVWKGIQKQRVAGHFRRPFHGDGVSRCNVSIGSANAVLASCRCCEESLKSKLQYCDIILLEISLCTSLDLDMPNEL